VCGRGAKRLADERVPNPGKLPSQLRDAVSRKSAAPDLR
jgi:hypothetical protein